MPCVVTRSLKKKKNLFGAKGPARSEKRKKNRPTLVQTLPPEG